MYNINIYFYYIYLNGEFKAFRSYKMYRKIQIKVKLEAIKYYKSNNNQKADLVYLQKLLEIEG